MAGPQSVIGGIVNLQINGQVYWCKGDATYAITPVKNTSVVGSDAKFHGVKQEPQVSFIEIKVTDRGDLDLLALTTLLGADVILSLPNGKSIALTNAAYTGDGQVSTGEGEINVRFEGEGQEIAA